MGKKYDRCNFCEEYEYYIYPKIGVRQQKKFNCMKSIKKVSDCTPFDKYTDWAKYFKNKFYKDDSDVYNILHYLKGMLAMYQKREDFWKTAVIPFYTVLLTVILTMFTTMQLPDINPVSLLGADVIFIPFILVVVIFLLIVMTSCYVFCDNCRNKIIFYENCIKVIKNAKASH